jgi:hypothetical protein
VHYYAQKAPPTNTYSLSISCSHSLLVLGSLFLDICVNSVFHVSLFLFLVFCLSRSLSLRLSISPLLCRFCLFVTLRVCLSLSHAVSLVFSLFLSHTHHKQTYLVKLSNIPIGINSFSSSSPYIFAISIRYIYP